MGLFTIAEIAGDPDLTIRANLMAVSLTGGLSLEGSTRVVGNISSTGSVSVGGRVLAGGGLAVSASDGSLALDIRVDEAGSGVVMETGGRRLVLGSQLVAQASQLRIQDDSGSPSEGGGGDGLPADLSIAEYMKLVVRASLRDPAFLLGLRDVITAQVEELQAAAAPSYDTLEPGPVVS